MIAVGVRHDQVGDPLTRFERGEHGLDVGGIVGARVDHGDLAVTDQVGTGAEVGERTGIVRHHPPDERRDGDDLAVAGLDLGDVRDGDGHGSGRRFFHAVGGCGRGDDRHLAVEVCLHDPPQYGTVFS